MSAVVGFEPWIGKEIAHCQLVDGGGDDTEVVFSFADGTAMALMDEPQCCERRYMTTDDDLSMHNGFPLLSVELREAPDLVDDLGEKHEVSFLLITSGRGTTTVETHNEHNGYYGGFWLEAQARA